LFGYLKLKSFQIQLEEIRKVGKITVLEGADVKPKCNIATGTINRLDSFSLCDHSGSDNPDDFAKGFSMHPHQEIEIVTSVTEREVNHKDRIGNSGLWHALC
jgi:redox-sensitive bicupin YhaK (pirin superfamily)